MVISIMRDISVEDRNVLFFCCCAVTQSCLTLCHPMDCSTPGFPVPHCLPEFAQTHVYLVSDAIRSSHPLLSPSPPAFNLSQHNGLFQGVGCLHQVAKVLELQHQSFQWIFRVSFRTEWFDLHAVQGTLRVFFSTKFWNSLAQWKWTNDLIFSVSNQGVISAVVNILGYTWINITWLYITTYLKLKEMTTFLINSNGF